MSEIRVKWERGKKGHLIIHTTEPLVINESRVLIDYLTDNCRAEDPAVFDPADLEFLGHAALFMAIRKIPAYMRGRVLDAAVASTTGGLRIMSSGYDWFTFPEELSEFRRGLDSLASYLEPIKTEAQPILREAAFDLIREKFDRYLR